MLPLAEGPDDSGGTNETVAPSVRLLTARAKAAEEKLVRAASAKGEAVAVAGRGVRVARAQAAASTALAMAVARGEGRWRLVVWAGAGAGAGRGGRTAAVNEGVFRGWAAAAVREEERETPGTCAIGVVLVGVRWMSLFFFCALAVVWRQAFLGDVIGVRACGQKRGGFLCLLVG